MALLAEWDPANYRYTGLDAVFSLLLDNPTEFYITPDQQAVFVYLYGRGLVRIIHDCRGFSDEQINALIYHFLRGI